MPCETVFFLPRRLKILLYLEHVPARDPSSASAFVSSVSRQGRLMAAFM
jgi:hypothetical protein